MQEQLTCLVTLHGVGFQQAPAAGIPGYADALHERLGRHLDAAWPGASPIYVCSHWPPESQKSEPGLARLGSWRAPGSIDHAQAPLGDGSSALVHVALVYAHPEELGSGVDASLEAPAQALVSHAHYVSVAGLARLAFKDTLTALQHRTAADWGAWSVIQTIEDDMSTYVCRNDLRTRLRTFVTEALLRLLARDDVSGIVVNAHSQGSVVAFDVLRALPQSVAPRVRAFVSSGSPLRKYVDLFSWGNEAGALAAMGDWTNFWDATDPTADPLAPAGRSLFEALDPMTGESVPISVHDVRVDNLANSVASGLQAHNYWENEREFVPQLAAILRSVAGTQVQRPELEAIETQAAGVVVSANGAHAHDPTVLAVEALVPAHAGGNGSSGEGHEVEIPGLVTAAAAGAAPPVEIPPPPPAPSPVAGTDVLPLGLVGTWASFRAPGTIASSK